MWLNIVGFIASIIFYCSVQFKVSQPPEIVRNPLQDTLLHIDFKLTDEIRQLQHQQKILIEVLKHNKDKLAEEKGKVSQAKDKIHITIKTDWDSLPKKQKDKYTEQLIDKFKNNKP